MWRSTPATIGGTTNAETLIRHAHQFMATNGVSMSPSKVTRLVREYLHKVAPRNIPFEEYLHNAVIDAADTHVRRAAGTVLTPEDKGKATAHNDQAVGETATWNVFIERDLPRIAEQGGVSSLSSLSVKDLVPDPNELQDICTMASVSDEIFNEVLAEARAEGDLSRANVVRKCHDRARP